MIEHEDAAHEIVGLRIWKDQKFGMAVFSSGIIDVFEFDDEERYWQNSIGFPSEENDMSSGKFFRRLQKFHNEHDEILSHYFRGQTLVILGSNSGLNELSAIPVFNDDGTISEIIIEWRGNADMMIDLNL